MIKAVAIDDEPLALEVISLYCQQLPNISLLQTFSNLDNAKRYLNKNAIDVLFLDIEMPKANGMDFYRSINREIKVIFTTAHSKYAVEGFKINACDYLLKPIDFDRFKDSVTRVETELSLETNNQEHNTHLSIRADYKLYHIKLEEIQRIEAMDDYVKIFQDNDCTIVARSTMKGILEKLPQTQFIRVHKSHIIPIARIKSIEGSEISLDTASIPLGNSYKSSLDDILKQ